MIAALTEVWTPLSVALAVISGLAVGVILVGRYAANPAYASGVASPAEYASLAGIMGLAIGVIFYGGQILTSYLGGDTEWTRVVSRFGIWAMYSLAIGLGTWIRIRRHIARRRAAVHDQAVAEVEGET